MSGKKNYSGSRMPTIQDVAKQAGVSHSTVSRVLNDNATTISISAETRQKILQAVEELGYQPNMIARSLRTQRSQMIAVMIGDISNAFYHPIVRAVQDIAGQHHYDVLIFNSDHLCEHEQQFLDAMLRRPVDGIIMASHCLTTDDLDKFIKRSRTPIVALGAQVKHPLIDVVGGTSEPATYEAVKWLIHNKGHQRIGFMSTLAGMPPGPSRYQGYRRAMSEAGLDIEEGFLQEGDFTIAGGQEAMHAFLQRSHLPTAIFASNSLMAIGAILVAREAGYRVPHDIAIMGFDDIPEAQIVTPPLTTVTRDLAKIGQQVAEILFERIEQRVTEPGRFFLSDWKLTIRESV
jgi:LacI family transcriptional regulator